MKNSILAGTGNSRFLKTVADAMKRYPTHESMIQAMVEGTFPLDLLLNPAGFEKLGDPLNKENLLKDTTAAMYGKTNAAVPDEIFAAIPPLIAKAQNPTLNCRMQTGSYVGTGDQKTLDFSFTAKFIVIVPGAINSTDPLFMAMHGGANVATSVYNNTANTYTYLLRSYGGGPINGTTYNVPIVANRAGITYYWVALGT